MYCLITEKGLDISRLRSEIEQKMKFKGAPLKERQGEKYRMPGKIWNLRSQRLGRTSHWIVRPLMASLIISRSTTSL